MKPILTTTRSLFKAPAIDLKISIKQRARRYSDAVLERLERTNNEKT